MSRRATTCRRGLHRLTPENIYTHSDGKRRCRACRAIRKRRWNAAHRDHVKTYLREWRRKNVTPKVRDHAKTLENLVKAREKATERLVPGEKIRPLVKWLVDRWGVTTTAYALKVDRQTVYNMLQGKAVRPRTARKIVKVMNYQAGQAAMRAGKVAA